MRLCLLVTRRCNLRCGFCHVEFTRQDMSWDTARKAIDRFLSWDSSRNAPRVKFFGGEPLLNWEIIRNAVESGRRRWRGAGIRFELASNGTFLDAEKTEFLRQHPEIDVTLSFPAPENTFLARFWHTMVLPPGSRPEGVVRDMGGLLNAGYRRFNFLPAYFTSWSAAELNQLRRSLEAAEKIIRGLWAKGAEIRVKNLEVVSSVPLYNDATTIDADGSIYASNFIQIRGTHRARKELHLGHVDSPSPLKPRPNPELLKGLLEKWAGPQAWNSTRLADEELTRFVRRLEPAKRSAGQPFAAI